MGAQPCPGNVTSPGAIRDLESSIGLGFMGLEFFLPLFYSLTQSILGALCTCWALCVSLLPRTSPSPLILLLGLPSFPGQLLPALAHPTQPAMPTSSSCPSRVPSCHTEYTVGPLGTPLHGFLCRAPLPPCPPPGLNTGMLEQLDVQGSCRFLHVCVSGVLRPLKAFLRSPQTAKPSVPLGCQSFFFFSSGIH